MGLFSKLVDRRISAYQSELIETHFAEVDNMYKKMRGWRHDYRNHIQVMKAYAAHGDLAAISDYLDKLDTDLKTVDTVVKTGNPMTDAILNSKIKLAQAKEITVEADAQIPALLHLPELDLCCIIGNLFDNAIEASLDLPKERRLIRVYMDIKGTQLYISFTNFTAGKKLPLVGGRIRSTKGEGHGFGLVRIDTIVERLGGYLSRGSEDGAFTTEILIPIELLPKEECAPEEKCPSEEEVKTENENEEPETEETAESAQEAGAEIAEMTGSQGQG